MVRNHDKELKIGMYSYALHLSGFGESWGSQEHGGHHTFKQVVVFKDLVDAAVEVGLDVLHITLVDIQNDTSDAHLAGYRKIAEEAGIELELSISFNAPSDPRVNCDVESSSHIVRKLGCNFVKYSMDMKYPEKLSHLYLAPSVMKQLVRTYGQFEKNLPLIGKYDMKIVTENHRDPFTDGVIWLVEQLNHPLIGVCCGTVNSLMVMERIVERVRKMAPYCYCVYFCDNRVFADPDGTYSLGTAIGADNVDCRAIMDILGEETPDGLDTINLEIELPLPGYSIEEDREMGLEGLCGSAEHMYKKLGIGRSPAKIYGLNSYFLNKQSGEISTWVRGSCKT